MYSMYGFVYFPCCFVYFALLHSFTISFRCDEAVDEEIHTATDVIEIPDQDVETITYLKYSSSKIGGESNLVQPTECIPWQFETLCIKLDQAVDST